MGDGGDERRIDAAGEGDDGWSGLPDDGLKAGELGLERNLDSHAGMIAR